MSGIVLDASAAIELVVSTRGLRAAVAAALADQPIHAPALLDAEVLSGIARLERAGKLDTTTATVAIAEWGNATVERHAGHELMTEAWRIRLSVRISDGFYLALARQLDAPLVTCDARLARSPHPGVTVTLIG